MIKRLLLKVVGYPPLWDLVRSVIEAGHRAEREIIRPAEWYETRLQRRFRIVRQEALLAGLWDYTVFVLRKEPDLSEK